MNEDRLSPLDAALDALLRAERDARPASDEALERVWSRIESSGAGHVRSRSGWRPMGAARGVGLVAFGFVAGGGVGALLHASLTARAPSPRVVYVDRFAETPSPAAPSFAPRSAAVPSPTTSSTGSIGGPRHVVVPSSATPVASAVPVSALSAERGLLDQARQALAEHDTVRALALAQQHATRFPHGELGEEREVIAIEALVLAERYPEARARAAAFRAQMPNSLFLPAIDDSLSSIPR